MHAGPPLGSPLSAAAASAGAAMAAANGFGAAVAATAGGGGGGGGRYSPTYRVPDQMRDPMRRCMTNPPVSETDNAYVPTLLG